MSSTRYLLNSVELNNIFKGSYSDAQLHRLINEKLCKVKFSAGFLLRSKMLPLFSVIQKNVILHRLCYLTS